MVVATAYLASGCIIPALPRWSLQHIRPPDVSLPLYQAGRYGMFGLRVYNFRFTMLVATPHFQKNVAGVSISQSTMSHVFKLLFRDGDGGLPARRGLKLLLPQVIFMAVKICDVDGLPHN